MRTTLFLKMSTALRTLSLFFFACVFIVANAYAGGIKGQVKDDKGEPLPYATIFVKQTGSGTTTNINGRFEIALAPGKYDVSFQYLSHESVVKQVEIGADFIEVDVVLKDQATVLGSVTVSGDGEDPAYTIMRKAIAKAKYHTQEVDMYSARVYIKGTGVLKDYPWLAKRALAKEGIKKGSVYVTESVSDIKYTRPKKFEEKVISIRSDGKDNNTSPNQYIFGSFYESEVAETISPLSPKAFSYYRFEYQGTFRDRDYEVSIIKVIPRSKGDNVIDGTLNIVEDWWSIHSMDIHTMKLGIDINIKAVYAPIEEKAWLPVSHQFKIDGKIFGFEFEYNYLATVSNYKIKMNPALYVESGKMEVIDEKVDKEQAKQVQQKAAAAQKSKAAARQATNQKLSKSARKAQEVEEQSKQLQERLASGKEITRKELNSIIKDYDKAEVKKQKEPEVISDVTFKIDSGAYKKDSTYWSEVRPVPLTEKEVEGYQKMDSMAVVERKKEAGDTVKASKSKGFQPWDLILGDTYKVAKHSNFKIHFPMPGFNTVEGWNLVYKVSYGSILQDTNKTRLTITPAFRYAFSRKVASGNLSFALRNKKYRFEVQGGRYIRQYNDDEPILPIVNDFTTLLLEKNLMKLYERDYVDVTYRRNISQYVSVHTDWSWMNRRELFNTSNYKWVDRKKIEGYTPNQPVNDELLDTSFPEHQAFVGAVGLVARPWLKYTIRNERKQEVPNSSPILSLDYRKAFDNVLNGDVRYDQVEVGFKHKFRVGVRGTTDVALRAGAFFNTGNMYFMDYKHFLGNQTPFITNDPVGSFRLLDYYRYSTADQYFAGNLHYQFRKFLVTNIPLVRLAGIRENVFVNYLATPTSKNYTEVGYSIDGILRIFRIEGAAAFQDGKYLNYGIRIGITSNFMVNFSDQ
ncbi:DUF5686 and carboxypeptidase regulatory-like domain-containing protein [Chryseolinea lacunae]|uniref:Carboxypeptidase-like regulatory domain-containing protein n=1 Tax=Chryseolinea lacunae TaxID=2801331 RepID=A0ABS1KUY3_9BACT|nr:DUF5686 and carboxypeptidase regulatory-like domain-containing protein [Chryseolinea lacunae]MBL0742131.1 carboxypeptidase-like regulatory domain-containing protein [Chryseolinea lacunae]